MRESKEKLNNKNVLIIGAGPAGLTAAYELSRIGVESVVIEKDSEVGGLSKTVHYKGYHFDIGGHRFYTRIKRARQIWEEVLGEDFLHCARQSRIYFNKRFFHYPLRFSNVFFGIGVFNSFMIMASYLNAQIFPSKQEETFEQWVSNRFGKRLFDIFFKNYTEKVWGVPCSEISSEWAEQRIQGLSVMSAVRNMLVNKNGNGNGRVIKTLINSFEYPKYGAGMLWDTMAQIVEERGCRVCLGAEADGIICEDNGINSVEINLNGEKKELSATHFISTMPLKELLQKLRTSAPQHVMRAAEALKYRDFITVALIINKRDIFPDNWIYVHDPFIKIGRIQNYKNWSPYMVPDPNKTCLGMEYFCYEGDGLWNMSDKDLIELCKTELETIGLIRRSDVEDGVVIRIYKAYPVYDNGYKENLLVILQFLSRFKNLLLAGRNGLHRYNNQDHSMLTAIQAVDAILK